ncbi:MAG: YIP1 family protein [Thermoplasmata archaeon]
MSSQGSVVFVSDLRCPSCGMTASGYLRDHGDGRGSGACPRCGAEIIQPITPGSVRQLPPQGLVDPSHFCARTSPHGWLYAQPKAAPGFCLLELLRIAYSPTKSLSRLYLCSDLKHALLIVLAFTLISTIVGVAVTESMADVLGYSASDAFGVAVEGAAGVIVAIMSFLVFGLVAAAASRGVFGGRGDRGSTIAMVAYCYPWFVFLTVVALTIFTAGFEGLDLERVQRWTDAEVERALSVSAVLLTIVVAGFLWLLWVVSKAIGMANDVATRHAALCAVLAAVAAGAVSLVVGAFIRLPIGISL